uniref:Erythropoietin receptor n=1 Tax=Monodelphis domestica TaxID=13616 RepID=F7BUV5_MONDO
MERTGPPYWPGIGSICVLLSAGAAWATPATQWELKHEPGLEGPLFESKVALLLAEEKEKPICFTQRLEDLVCFWEEMASLGSKNYSFFYQLDEEIWKLCMLQVVWTGRGTIRYTCTFPLSDASSFIPVELKVIATPPDMELRRTLYINEVVFLDPPSGLTAQQMETPSQVALRWLPPPMAQVTKDIHYEVKYSVAEGTWEQRMDIQEGRTDCIIANLREHTRYVFTVRAKMAEPSYSGYWSSWSQPVTMLITVDLDPLLLGLSVLLTCILLLLVILALLRQRRFLKEMFWPGIPSPEPGFKDLFTIHRGNFELWLGQSNACLWWGPLSAYPEEPPARLEVLSERCWVAPAAAREEEPLLVPERGRLAQGAKDDYLVLDAQLLPHRPAAEPLRPSSFGLRGSGSSTSRALGAEGDSAMETDAKSGSFSTASISALEPEHEERGLASNFEYTILDPSSRLLCPRVSPPFPPPRPPDLKYLYLVVSDSGISADYSSGDSQGALGSSPDGPYTNLYENSLLQPSSEPLPQSYLACS